MSHPLTVAPKTDPTALYRYRDGLYAEDLLILALVRMDFFTALAAEPTDLEGLRQRHQLHERPADVMVTLFRAMGLIKWCNGRYEVTETAREHLVSTSRWFLGPYYESLVDRPVVKDLQRVLQTDKPANWGSQTSQPDWHKAMEKPDFARQFTQAMDCRGVFLARALAEHLPIGESRSLLDIAGGSGIYACSLCAHFPELRATVLEKPPVDAICAQAIAARGFSDRVQVVAGDMLNAPLPRGHDLHLYSNVLHDWDVPVVRDLLARSFEALPSGGRLLIHDAFLNRDKSGPLHVAEYSVMLMHATQGRCYGVGEMETWLRATGFVDCLELPGGAARSGLIARKP